MSPEPGLWKNKIRGFKFYSFLSLKETRFTAAGAEDAEEAQRVVQL